MKKFIYKYFIPALFFTTILISCNKFLDIQPKGVKLLKTVADYDLWMKSQDLLLSCPMTELDDLADITDYPTLQQVLSTNSSQRIYTWKAQFSDDIATIPIFWNIYYQSIYYYNTILEGINSAKDGTEQEKKSLRAEALLGRAFEYLYLVNLYGKPYNSSTASEDLAVPFVSSIDLTYPTPARSSVKQIYDRIISDISEAVPDLPEDNNSYRSRGCVAAAYSVLARTYLYMADYTKAAQNAQLALDNCTDTILDYSVMSSSKDIPNLLKRPDEIYARYGKSISIMMNPSLSFLQSFDIKDLRLKFYYTKSYVSPNLGDYSFNKRGEVMFFSSGATSSSTGYLNCGTSVAEMHLILAEAAARRNDLITACNELDVLRKKRFPANYYVKYESSDQENVINKVLAERSFEFSFNGMRWFDMRRLAAEGRMQTIKRYDASNNVLSTLSADSPKYTLQIPLQVLYFNSDWPQNSWEE